MFSVTKTGTWRRPSWTAMVCPIMCGKITLARDQVFSTLRSLRLFMSSTRPSRRASTYGPFLTDRLIGLPYPRPYRRRTIILLLALALVRVRRPMAGLPQGVLGGIPVGDLPSPPPCGWSRGFIAEPRTSGRRPRWRDRPALPMLWLPWSRLLRSEEH